MLVDICLVCILLMTFAMVAAKRIPAIISGFRAQSFFLFLLTFFMARMEKSITLYAVALLLLLVKVILIPYFLRRIVNRIKVDEAVGFIINPTLSLLIVIFFSYLASVFTGRVMPSGRIIENSAFTISLSVTLSGLFLMVFRVKALTQIIGLLVMENGLFLAAAAVCGGMPFFVEIAVFFDIFVCVVILGVFVFRINKLFTHIDISKLTKLKG